jgi:AcrR family transcriptional regulator
VTVADICAAARIAPRTFFRYFPAKEDVLVEPVREMTAQMEASIREAPEDLPDDEVLRLALRGLGEYCLAQRQRLRDFFRVATDASALRASPLTALSAQERRLAEVLARRHSSPAPVTWRERLRAARAVAAFRIWMDDIWSEAALRAEPADPLAHLDEVLAAR